MNSVSTEEAASEPEVLVEQRDRILIITINRPKAKNAVNSAVSHGLADAVDRLDGDPGLSVGIVTGAGGTFCAGMDLKAFARGEVPIVEGRGMGFTERGPVKPLISINEYFDLILIVLVGLGIIFELPVLIFILSLFGIVTPQFLLKNFRYAMLIITVLAAIATPTPDATTMLIFMAAMVLLYLLGVLVSYFVVRQRRSRKLADGEAQ